VLMIDAHPLGQDVRLKHFHVSSNAGVRVPATSYLIPLFTLIYLVLFHLLLPSHLDVPCYLNNRQRYCSVWPERDWTLFTQGISRQENLGRVDKEWMHISCLVIACPLCHFLTYNLLWSYHVIWTLHLVSCLLYHYVSYHCSSAQNFLFFIFFSDFQ
jgi:hypothetical protein